MKIAPLPPTEEARIAALRQTGALDTEPEGSFDYLTILASEICGTPIALITLVDVDRQWFKSCVGVEIAETPRDVAFCAHTILQPDLMVVSDALQDERFADNPLVTAAPRIRFYAGSPLVTHDGHAIGTLCVIDTVPRRLSPEQVEALRTLARHASAMLGLRRTKELLRAHAQEWERAEGDAATRSAALAKLGDDLKDMIAEREQAEASLRALESDLRRAGVVPEEFAGSAALLEEIVERSERICRELELDHPLREQADRLVQATRRAQTLQVEGD